MADYEVDLELLEDMCSELEETALLLDKSLNVVWVNAILKQRLELKEGSQSKNFWLDAPSMKAACIKLLGPELFLSESPAAKVFMTGKLVKTVTASKHGNTKKISLPVKYGRDVIYVLEIIEESFQGMLTDDKRLLKYYADSEKFPCIMADANNKYVISNTKFERNFKDAELLVQMMIQQLNNSKRHSTVSNLQSLVGSGYRVTSKELKNEEMCGFAYYFQIKSVKSKHKRR